MTRVVGASANPLPPAKRSTVTPVVPSTVNDAAALLDLDEIGGGSQAAFERALEVVVGRGGRHGLGGLGCGRRRGIAGALRWWARRRVCRLAGNGRIRWGLTVCASLVPTPGVGLATARQREDDDRREREGESDDPPAPALGGSVRWKYRLVPVTLAFENPRGARRACPGPRPTDRGGPGGLPAEPASAPNGTSGTRERRTEGTQAPPSRRPSRSAGRTAPPWAKPMTSPLARCCSRSTAPLRRNPAEVSPRGRRGSAGAWRAGSRSHRRTRA